ncbi:hypothetical protein RR11_3352 [Ruegeria sp. R11]|nr:hypothetical protein RR11_3352 [Ruegeria sp. R11]
MDLIEWSKPIQTAQHVNTYYCVESRNLDNFFVQNPCTPQSLPLPSGRC